MVAAAHTHSYSLSKNNKNNKKIINNKGWRSRGGVAATTAADGGGGGGATVVIATTATACYESYCQRVRDRQSNCRKVIRLQLMCCTP